MAKFFRFLVATTIAFFAIGSLTACASEVNVDMSSVAAVVDVRTPQEYSEGHLDGALNIDFQGPNFSSEISTLDSSANYVIYCRSGNRAGKAIEFMKTKGFTGILTNAGAVAEASSLTGMTIVK